MTRRRLKEMEKLKHFVLLTAKGIIPSTIIISEGGLGKSYTTQKILREHGFPYVYYNSYSTPLALYRLLYEHRNDLIIFDDVEGILSDRKAIAILKGALWDNGSGKRIVTYETSQETELPRQFEFTGRIIILANSHSRTDPNLSALLTRMNYLKLNFTLQEKLEIIRKVAKAKRIPPKIVKFIESYSNAATRSLNIRTLIKIYQYYLYNRKLWKLLALNELKPDPEKQLILKLMKSNKPVSEQVRIWREETGKSRATYFRLKKEIKETLGGLTNENDS